MPAYANLKSGKGEDPKGQPQEATEEGTLRRGNDDEEDFREAVHSDPQPGGLGYRCWRKCRVELRAQYTHLGVHMRPLIL